MASMRVHELAKEFDMSSGDLLDRLKEMKIPAKSHASMLNDAYVDKIRKNLEPEIRARAGALEAEEAAALAAEQEEAERKRAEEEAERKAAREKELAERAAARARREGSRSDDDAEGEEHQARKQAPKQPSAFASLEQQIASEKERVERERQEARARARAEKAAAEVAKKRAVEEALRRGHKKPAKAAPAPAPARPAPAPAPSRPKNNFDSLLSQIEAEKQRMEAAKSAQADTRAPRGGKKGKTRPAAPPPPPRDRPPQAVWSCCADWAARQSVRACWAASRGSIRAMAPGKFGFSAQRRGKISWRMRLRV